jgi:hypothetical protein
VEFSVRRPSPLNTYSYVREENSGSTRKLVQNYLWFLCITNLILALHTQRVNGPEEPFAWEFGFNKKIHTKLLVVYIHPWSVGWRNLSKTAEKEILQPTRSKCG